MEQPLTRTYFSKPLVCLALVAALTLNAGPSLAKLPATGGSDAGQKCRVAVLRTATGGTANVVRQVIDNGSCVCTITTGPANNNGKAEAKVANLLRDRKCDVVAQAEPKIAKSNAFFPFGVTPIVALTAATAAAATNQKNCGKGSNSQNNGNCPASP